MSWLDAYFIGVSNVVVNGTTLPKERGLNLIQGTNVTLSAVDNIAQGRTDVTISASGGGGGSFTAGGDLSGSSTSQTVTQITGTSNAVTLGASTTGAFSLNAAPTVTSLGFQFNGTTRASLSAAHGVITAGGGGTDYKALMGPLVGSEASFAALWLLANATAANGNNCVLYSNGSALSINAPNSGGNFSFVLAGGTTLLNLANNGALAFTAQATGAGISQAIALSGAGQAFAITAQAAASGSAAAGGNLTLSSGAGDGAGAAGAVVLQTGGTTRARLDPAHGLFSAGGAGADWQTIIGPLVGFENQYGGIWALPPGGTPTGLNCLFYANGSTTAVNAAIAGGSVSLVGGGGSTFASFSNAQAAISSAAVAFGGITTQTTAPSAGGAAALPTTPAGYAQFTIGGTVRRVPYY